MLNAVRAFVLRSELLTEGRIGFIPQMCGLAIRKSPKATQQIVIAIRHHTDRAGK